MKIFKKIISLFNKEKEQEQELFTYDEWNSKGYRVLKGEKAKRIDGKCLFSRDQVIMKRTFYFKHYPDALDDNDDVTYELLLDEIAYKHHG